MAEERPTSESEGAEGSQTQTKKAKDPKKSPPRGPEFLIVGIGASAGGLEAFKQFFEKMPPDSGMAFVVVQHLDPTHKSMLSQLLRNYTKMTVLEVKDNTKVAPNTIYTIPPNKEMGILNGTLQLMQPMEARGHRRIIDYFMRSLASDQKEKGVGIILSGTGTEGVIGLKAIKGEGGLAIVQEPASAKYDGMPRSVIGSNAADIVLPADEMPAHLIRYSQKRKMLPIGVRKKEIPKQNLLNKIFLVLRDRTGNNFTHYKLSTISRRIDKRMALNQITDLDTYLSFLKNTPREVDLLFKELLIGVTSFFRDREAFESLQTNVIEQILSTKGIDDTIRVWVPGCSTGEEAYSLAMLFEEAMLKKKMHTPLQIFASDIDDKAIDMARLGIYPESIASDVESKLLHHYLRIDHHSCMVKKEIRDKVIFAVQNVISDPPFSNLDLICCRNLLIYLNADAQRRVFPIFHYSLNPQGFLFLGTSETIGQFNNLFGPVDRKNKIFVRKTAMIDQKTRFGLNATTLDPPIPFRNAKGGSQKKLPVKLADITERVLLMNYAPSCVVVDDKNVALYFYGNTGKYLQPTPGEASLNILDMARSGLKATLRTLINRVRKNKKEEIQNGVRLKTDSGYEKINLKVQPITHSETEESLVMIIFEEHKALESVISNEAKETDELDNPHIVELEHELISTKEYLRTTVEELEISNEELKSSNEELQSANEELQSTNEELETSKEELQSVNEEMITVNTELQNKIDELSHAHDDMYNLLASTEIGTVFLGRDLEIKRFTPSISKVLNLLPSDIGRPISDLSSNLIYDNLTQDAQSVLNNLVAKRTAVRSRDGSWFQLQITPYRSTENVINGVVMSFVDISEERKMEEELIKVNKHLLLAMEALPAVPFTFIVINKNIEFRFIGKTSISVLGYASDNFISDAKFWIDRIHADDKEYVLDNLLDPKKHKQNIFEFRWKCSNDRYKKLRSHLNKALNAEEENLNVGIWHDLSIFEDQEI